jgi:hypothetical protein
LTDQDVTGPAALACTAACTSEGENRNGGDLDQGQDGKSEGAAGTPADALAAIAAAVSALGPADRERLAALLAGDQDQGRRTDER